MKPNNCIKNRLHTKSDTVYLCLCISFIGILALLVSGADAQETKRGEYEVKAAFIYNFLKFVQWPDKAFSENPSTINVCIVGEDPFGSAIKIFQGEKVSNKTIEINRPESLHGVKNCQVLFISRSEKERLPQILKAIRGLNILSIGDTDMFEHQGVIINFSLVQDKVRFEIDINAARQAGIRISSKLLSLARAVYE
jgi:YfiR/HmsC-like